MVTEMVTGRYLMAAQHGSIRNRERAVRHVFPACSSAHSAGHHSRHNPPIIASLIYLIEAKNPSCMLT
jgi:hypothetical protein